MSKLYDKYLKFIEENQLNYINKDEIPQSLLKLTGSYGNFIEFKNSICLNYGNSNEIDTIYIEDISENKKFTNDLKKKKFKLHLSDSILYIDFNTDYYYALLEFDNFEQFEQCKKYKKLTIALLNDDRSDIINKWTTDVNLL